MVAVPQQSPLAALDNVELADLSEHAFISIPHKDRGGLSYLVTNLCLEQGFFPKPARALSRKSSQLSLIEAGLSNQQLADRQKALQAAEAKQAEFRLIGLRYTLARKNLDAIEQQHRAARVAGAH